MKSGWKTTEFWMTIVLALLMVARLFGFVDDNTDLDKTAMTIGAGVAAAIAVGSYAVSRGLAKFNETRK